MALRRGEIGQDFRKFFVEPPRDGLEVLVVNALDKLVRLGHNPAKQRHDTLDFGLEHGSEECGQHIFQSRLRA